MNTMKQLILMVSFWIVAWNGQATESEIHITTDNYHIPAVLNVPNKPAQHGKYPAIVMLHGTASHKDEVGDLYKSLAAKLAELGIASIRIDFAGFGDSEVAMTDYTLTSAVKDATAALDHLSSHPLIDIERLGVIGFSQGALIAQLVAVQHPSIKTLVAWSPAIGDGITAMQDFYNAHIQQAKTEGFARIELGWRDDLLVSKQWFDELANQTSLSDLANFTGATLAISGSEDKVLPWENATTLVNATGSDNAQAIVIKGADHIFNVLQESQPQPNALLSITTHWLSHNL